MVVSQEMTLYWNGTDCSVVFMEEVEDLIFFIKQILTDQYTKLNRVPKKLWWMDLILMEKFASFITLMIIIFVLSAINLSLKMVKIQMGHLNPHNYHRNRINCMWWLESLLKCFLACTLWNGVKYNLIFQLIGLSFLISEEEKKEFNFVRVNKIRSVEETQLIA